METDLHDTKCRGRSGTRLVTHGSRCVFLNSDMTETQIAKSYSAQLFQVFEWVWLIDDCLCVFDVWWCVMFLFDTLFSSNFVENH